MKKLYMVLFVVIMFFGIVGCPSSDDPASTYSKTNITSTTSTKSIDSGIDPVPINDDNHSGIDSTLIDDGGYGGASPVPEPATLILLGSGLLGLGGVGRKKFFKKD